jgi:hypothetical protein
LAANQYMYEDGTTHLPIGDPNFVRDATNNLITMDANVEVGGFDNSNIMFPKNLYISGPRPFIDVRAYGAKGTGGTTADDTSAIQNAINAAAAITAANLNENNGERVVTAVYFPAPVGLTGFYRISAPLHIDFSYAVLVGATPAVTIKNVTTGSDVIRINTLFETGTTDVVPVLTGVEIRNLTLIGTVSTSGKGNYTAAPHKYQGARYGSLKRRFASASPTNSSFAPSQYNLRPRR